VNTITKTSKAGITRKLSGLNFDKYNYATQMGFFTYLDFDVIVVVNHTNADYEGTAARELEAAGYLIENRRVNDWSEFLGRKVEIFNVIGRVEA
jgi:hypothetical protein